MEVSIFTLIEPLRGISTQAALVGLEEPQAIILN
jgi:hypothetical protein